MTAAELSLIIACIDTFCWIACFIWMHRISTHQDGMMAELHKVMRRTEETSKAEHELIKEVHPKVEAIEQNIREVVEDSRGKK